MTLGCYYRNTGVGFMSMYGSVTDTQVFSRGLSVQEMVDITSCRSQQYLEIQTLSTYYRIIYIEVFP